MDIFATGKHVNHRDKYGLEIATNPYIFMDLKRPLNWLKSKITEIEENLNETKTLSKVKCVQVSCKKCLLLNVFIIENSVVGGNVNWDRQMSVIKRPLHRGFVMRV